MVISQNLRRLSRTMAWIATLAVFLVPIAALLNFFPQTVGGIPLGHGDAFVAKAPLQLRIAAFCVWSVPLAFLMWAWWSLRRLFLHYADGNVFTGAALRQLYTIALALVCAAVAGFFADPVGTLLVMWNTGWSQSGFGVGILPASASLSLMVPVGARHSLLFLLGPTQVAAFAKAAVVYVIARVMSEGSRLADENAKFV